jgi:hypothetical protein
MSEQESNLTVPSNDLDSYLSDPFNQGIHEDLEELGLDSLKFFNFFYRLAALIDEGHPSKVIQELDAQAVDGGARLYVLHLLRELKYGRLAGIVGPPADVEPSMFVIDKEYERVEKLFPPEMFPVENPSLSDGFCHAVGKDQFINQAMGRMINGMMEKAEHERAIKLQARQEEREHLEQTASQMVLEVLKAVKQPHQNPEFTTNRQVLAIGLMLKALGVTDTKKTTQADFIQFLTGKTNKEIYKRVGDELIAYNRAGQDGEYVRDWFVRLGLNDLAKEIEDLLSKQSDES